MSKKSSIKIGPYRCIFPTLAEPKVWSDVDPAKYSIKILIPKVDKTEIARIEAFVKEAVDQTDWPQAVKARVTKTAKDLDPYNDNGILKDGDALNQRRVEEEKDAIDAYAGHRVLSLSKKASFGAPLIVDENAKTMPGLEIAQRIIGGFWVNVSASFYCYSKPKQGITLQLQAVQKVTEDEQFGVANPFDPIEIEEPEETLIT